MGGYVYVMEQRDFDNWLSGNVSGQTPVEAGKDLFENKLGCASCHAGGPQQRGAKLEGIFNHDVKLVGGQTVKADEEYIRNSILNPSGTGRRRLPADHADVQGPGDRGAVELACRLYQVAERGSGCESTTTAPGVPAASTGGNDTTAPANTSGKRLRIRRTRANSNR